MKVMTMLAVVCSVLLSTSAFAFDQEGFLAEVRSETKVKDAMITDNGAIYVGVLDDGENRDGYASYICAIARDYSDSRTGERLIKIIDIVAVTQNKGFKELGRHWCEV